MFLYRCSSLVGCKRNRARTTEIRAQFSKQTTKNRAQRERPNARTTKIWAQSSTQTKQDLGTILWAIDENMGTNLQASLAV